MLNQRHSGNYYRTHYQCRINDFLWRFYIDKNKISDLELEEMFFMTLNYFGEFHNEITYGDKDEGQFMRMLAEEYAFRAKTNSNGG